MSETFRRVPDISSQDLQARSLKKIQLNKDGEEKKFAQDVLRGLSSTPKTLPCLYLYDSVGSSLFEAICSLREYKCFTGETRLLEQHTSSLLRYLPPDVQIVELGGGTGRKASIIVGELLKRQISLIFHNIDVSLAALKLSGNLITSLGNVQCFAHPTTFLEGLAEVSARRQPGVSLLVLFLGSSIGNYDRQDSLCLLRSIRRELSSKDWLLLGVDLVKPEDQLIQAYNDPQGVTACFNLNLLARINWELGGNFNLSNFHHRAVWNVHEQAVEMKLVSSLDQSVWIDELAHSFHFHADEAILTERSYKYRCEEIGASCAKAGYFLETQWVDEHAQFSCNLLRCS